MRTCTLPRIYYQKSQNFLRLFILENKDAGNNIQKRRAHFQHICTHGQARTRIAFDEGFSPISNITP